MKDATKYSFNGLTKLGKGRLVLEIVRKFAADNPELTYSELVERLPGHIPGFANPPVIETLENALVMFQDKEKKIRHFIADEEIQVAGCGTDYVVCVDWGIASIPVMIAFAKEQGYDVLQHL